MAQEMSQATSRALTAFYTEATQVFQGCRAAMAQTPDSKRVVLFSWQPQFALLRAKAAALALAPDLDDPSRENIKAIIGVCDQALSAAVSGDQSLIDRLIQALGNIGSAAATATTVTLGGVMLIVVGLIVLAIVLR